MNNVPPKTLLNSLSQNDPGDDTQRRYRYQAFYTALLSLEFCSTNPDLDIDELFCEHHEDTLVRLSTGKFIGVQVKTRQSGKEPFKSDDRQILSSIVRFTNLYIEYPKEFCRFVIATNYAFWTERKNGKNLPHLLELVKSVGSDSEIQNRPLLSYIRKICSKIQRDIPDEEKHRIVFEVLKIVEATHDLPKFDDIENKLACSIPQYYDAGEACLDELIYVARQLINRMFEAGSLQHVSAQKAYFALFENPTKRRTEEIIDGKRIRRDDVLNVLQKAISESSSLTTHSSVSIADLPSDMRLLELKMNEGKISLQNIRQARDNKYSAELLLQQWVYKYGVEKADKRFKQLNVIVGNECQEAYDIAFSNDKPFGQNMLIDVRQRLRNRIKDEPSLFYKCIYEHVLGISGILTEMCHVWWSKEFEIPE